MSRPKKDVFVIKIQDRQVTAGKRGEERIAHILKQIPGGRLFTNVWVHFPGGSAELDAVLLTPKGIIVFEIKSFAAQSSIVGSRIRYEWTQTYRNPSGAKGKARKRKFYSPIRQNARHIELLSERLGLPTSAFHSCIVFTSSCELKKVPPNTRNYTILQENQLRSFVVRYLEGRETVLQPLATGIIARRLNCLQGAAEGERQAHVRFARKAERMRRAEQQKRRESRNGRCRQ